MPKRGGVLALKAFLTSFALSVVLALAAKGHEGIVGMGMVVCYAAGAAYIILTLRKWERQKQIVRGTTIGWIVACFQIMICIGSLAVIISDATKGTGNPCGILSLENSDYSR